MSLRSALLGTFAIAILCASQLPAQQNPVSEKYIENTFQAQIGEVPKMGWFDPDHGFLASQNAAEIALYGPLGMMTSGRKTGEISGAEIRSLQRLQMACEISPRDPLTVFDVGTGTVAGRGLYTTKKLPGQARSGLVSVQLDPDWTMAVTRALGWPSSGALRRDEAIAVHPESFFYSVHKLYSSTTGLLREEAIVLHGSNGQIIGFDVTRNLDSKPFCDGCGNPGYEHGNIGLYRPMNMFELPGFLYPLMLMDTGTVEGRALSLLTFTPRGKPDELRVYEYVVNCPQ